MGEADGADSAPPQKAQSDGGAPPLANAATASSSSSSMNSDVPARKLARQLDFTGIGVPPPSGAAQPQLPAAATAVRGQPRPPAVPVPTPVPPPQPSVPSVRKPDSPTKSRPRPNAEAKDGTPKKQKQCNCKHSRCLKLYCECFASGIYCDGCNCVNCCNNVENEGARRDAVEATLERNPNAFRPKIASSPHGTRDTREEAGEVLILAKHNKGCHCKKSGCLKKYCECFQANILCSENCKCVECKNFEGSEERQAIFHGDRGNNMAYLQQAANAAITGAIGSSGYASTPPVSRKRKGQELYGPTAKDPSLRIGQFQEGINIRAPGSSSLSSVPVSRSGGTAGLGTSKYTYRSLLADIIQPQDLKELCSVLVLVAEEAAKALTDQKNTAEKPTETSCATTTQDRLQIQNESDAQKAVPDDCSTAKEADKISGDGSNSDGADVPEVRPMSPGTLALMCDEQDTMFMTAASSNGLIGDECDRSSQLPKGQGMTEVFTAQERIVLTKFRDCLNKLITFGEIRETTCSSLARSEAETQRDKPNNGITNGRTQTGSQQAPVSNGPRIETGNQQASVINGARIETNNQQAPVSNGVARPPVPPPAKTTVSQTVTPAVLPQSKPPSHPENRDSKPKE